MPGEDDDPLATRSLDACTPLDPRPCCGPASLDPAVSLRIGRYRIERRLGGGGMGVVYLAHDPDLDRHVAIKVLRPALCDGRARLLREGQAIARLSHANVVTVYDVGHHGDDLFIAMEYVDGDTLGRWLAATPRCWQDVLGKFIAAGHGLAAAHARGLVHRDFKPDNVLLGRDGRVVVSDFGLARVDADAAAAPLHDVDATTTQTGSLLGTPAYMSPEQFAGAPVDARSDQFSFCVALWLGVYGRRPFEPADGPSLSVEALSRAVRTHAIVEPPADRGVPARLEPVLRRGLAVDPAARHASLDALLDALRPRPRRPTWAAVAAGAVVMAVTGGTFAMSDPTPPARSIEAGQASLVVADPADVDATPENVRWFDEIAAWPQTPVDVGIDQRRRERGDPQRRACLTHALAAVDRALR